VGKVGESTDPVNQSKPNGHQGKGKTIDDSVDENVHNETDIGELE